MYKITFLTFALLLTGCTTAPGTRPTAATYPPGYLKTFPLNISEEEAIQKMGPPDSVYEAGGKKWLKYFAPQNSYRSYNILIENSLVTDVIYNESGSLNGESAKILQKK